MKTLNLVQAQSQTTVQSRLILGAALLAAAAAISLAFQHTGNAKNTDIALDSAPIQQVVIEGKRMTAEEKLAYDLAPEGIARVEIIGKRLSTGEKLAVNAEDSRVVKHAAMISKA